MATLSLRQTEDKLLALFSAGGVAVIAESYLQASPDPHLQAAGGLLVAVGVFLKAVIAPSSPKSTTQ